MKLQFKAKVQTMHDYDDTPLYRFVQVPKVTRRHVDMHEARCHPKFGSYANSDMFPSMLVRACAATGLKTGSLLKIDTPPEGVSVDDSGFLAVITVDL
jgi:hypothetical protein